MASRTISTGLAATALALCCAAPAHAALTLTGVSCSGQSTGMTSLAGYTACGGAFSGNNLNQATDVNAFLTDEWGLSVLSTTDITGSNSSGSGTLSFAGQSGIFVIALKAGDAFSLYEFDASSFSSPVSSLAYDTLGVGFYSSDGKKMKIHFGQDLSHATLYEVDSGQGPSGQPGTVPEPSSAVMALAGLAALMGLTRRRARPAASQEDAG